MRSYTYFVSGKGEFPIDMLRYDQAFPASETDAYKIVNSFSDRTIMLRSYIKPLGAGRWNSFGWEFKTSPI